jgi:hypothetical protein
MEGVLHETVAGVACEPPLCNRVCLGGELFEERDVIWMELVRISSMHVRTVTVDSVSEDCPLSGSVSMIHRWPGVNAMVSRGEIENHGQRNQMKRRSKEPRRLLSHSQIGMGTLGRGSMDGMDGMDGMEVTDVVATCLYMV